MYFPSLLSAYTGPSISTRNISIMDVGWPLGGWALQQYHYIKHLRHAALIRELHVYGSLKVVNDRSKCGKPQHRGFGKQLVRVAENKAFFNGYRKIAIISGVGVRNYYRQMGYTLMQTYMVKHISWLTILKNYFFLTVAYLSRSFTIARWMGLERIFASALKKVITDINSIRNAS